LQNIPNKVVHFNIHTEFSSHHQKLTFQLCVERTNSAPKQIQTILTLILAEFTLEFIGTGLFGLAVSVTGHFGLAVSVWGHFGHDISLHKQIITFVYLNDYRQVKCHSNWCYTNSLWGVMIAIKSAL